MYIYIFGKKVKQQITDKLQTLRDQPNIDSYPLIYHLDVGVCFINQYIN